MLHTLLLSVVLRSSTIAGKYATFQKEQLQKYCKLYISKKELDNELMMIDWLKQKSSIIFEEISNSILRKEIDVSTFKLSFFVKLGKEVDLEIEEIVERKDGFGGIQTVNHRFGGQECRYYDARIVFEYFIGKFNERNKIGIFNILFFLTLSILYGMLNGILRMIEGKCFDGETSQEKFIFYTVSLSNCFLMFTTVMFYDQANRDLRAKSYVLDQLGQLISARKIIEFSNTKLLPTLSLTDPVSMNTWMNLRKLALDYGLRFFYRHQIFFPVILIIGTLSTVIAFSIHIYWKKSEKQKIAYLFWFDHILMFSMVFKLLFNSARVNSHFASHSKAIGHNFQIFSELLRFKEFYFKQKYEELHGLENFSETESEEEFPFKKKSQSFVHKRIIEQLIQKKICFLKKLKEESEFYEYIGNCLENVKDLYTELDHVLQQEEKFYGLKILGLKVTKTGFFNFFFAFVSILVTSYEVFVKE